MLNIIKLNKKNMISRIKFHFLLCILFLWIPDLLSAQNWDFTFKFNVPAPVGHFEIYNGQTLNVIPKINSSPNMAGSFSKVMYYLDGNLLHTETEPSFDLNYKVTNISDGNHDLFIVVYCKLPNSGYQVPFNFKYKIKVLGSINDQSLISTLNEASSTEDNFRKLELYKEAAKYDNVMAMEQLAIMYFKGIGTDINIEEALYWSKKLEQIGSWSGIFEQGNIYQKKNQYADALSYYKKAAESIYDPDERSFAAYVVGRYYEDGLIGIKNTEEARKWYKRAAEDKDENAIERLKAIDNNSSINGSNEVAKLLWLGATGKVKSRCYELNLGINSQSKIQDVTVYLNGELVPNITLKNTNDETSYIKKELSLANGENIINILVRNSNGLSTLKRNVLFFPSAPIDNTNRIALVIGNANYGGIYNLENSEKDATDIAVKLQRLGFHVIKAMDQDKQNLEKTLKQFEQEAESYPTAMLYYAGHGISIGENNYIIPINANLTSESQAKSSCTDVNHFIDVMDMAGCKLKILVLDACRNNPFAKEDNMGISNKGLTVSSAPAGTLIAYSTSPGTEAKDGIQGQRNSPYATAFLEMLDKPNLPITVFFKNVLDEVAKKTHDEQIPWTTGKITNDFYFNKQ